MDDNRISPWAEEVEIQSPNGEFIGLFCDGSEIAMGAPSMGRLLIKKSGEKDYKVSLRAAASFIWSDDSGYFAYSEWTKEGKQSIRIIKMIGLIDKLIDAVFSVVQFTTFENGIIEGIDSPIYMPMRFRINIAEIDFTKNAK